MSWPKPFFVKEKPKTRIKGYDCESCGLYKGCKSPKMEPTGEGRLGVLCVAEANGENEDLEGIQLIGDAGQLFRKKLAVHSLDLDRDFWKTNSLECRTPSNREPRLSELKCCRPRLFKAIEELKPKMIWLMGNHALESYFMDRRLDNKKIGLWRKRCIPDPLTNAYIIPMLHPSFMLRNQGNKNIESVYDRDLKWAIAQTSRKGPTFPSYEDKIKIITDYEQLVQLLDSFTKNEQKVFVFDYETSSLRPFREGGKIVSISFCYGEEAFAFPYQYQEHWSEKQLNIIKQKWVNVLINPNLKKVAHGLKFEDGWTRFVFGIQPEPWECCSMTTQHILDGRTGGAGLKFQCFVRWGIYGYDESIDSFKKDTGNGLNRMEEAPLMELLKYNGEDSLFGYWLYKEQQEELGLGSNSSLKKATDFFHEGLLTFSDMEESGFPVDINYYKKEDKRIDGKIKQLEEKLYDYPIVKEFENKEGKKINWGSNKDLPKLLFQYCGIKSQKKTASGKNESVDGDALEMYKDKFPFVSDLLSKRKLEKIKGTYLNQIMEEENNGRIYPILNLHTTRTYRSSCDSPNLQNIPVRDEEAKKSTRMGIIPSMGNKILEVDYSGLEVSAAACYTKDPVLIDYLTRGGDMHKDEAIQLFKLPSENVTKDIRFYTKNQWVFPEFYGSYFVSCARNLWPTINKLKLEDGKPLKQHLKDNRIITYQAFEAHCERKEKEFWDRFKVFRKWQEKEVGFFQTRGFVELFHGFRRSGLLGRNEIINSPFQGTGFHILLASCIKINQIRKEEEWETKMPMQIHDSILFDLVPAEEKNVLKTVSRVMTKDIPELYKWICVPLRVEIEMTEINEAWYLKKPIKNNF